MNYVLIGVALWLFRGDIALPKFMQHQPPVAQLSAAEVELAKAKAAQAAAEAKLAQTQAAAAEIKERQLDYTQQMVAGAKITLDNLPSSELTAGVKVAHEFVTRADAGFIAARGALSPEAQAAIDKLYNAAMAAKDHELETLKAALSQTDAERRDQATKRALAEAQIPALKADVDVAKAQTETKAVEVDTLHKEVTTYAADKAAARAEAGSWQAYALLGLKVIIGAAVLYLLVHVALPCVAQSYPGIGWLTTASNAVKNLTTAHQ